MTDYAPVLQFAQTGPLIGNGGVTWSCPAIWVVESTAAAITAMAHTRATEQEADRCLALWDAMASIILAHGINARVTFRHWQIIAGVFVPDVQQERIK